MHVKHRRKRFNLDCGYEYSHLHSHKNCNNLLELIVFLYYTPDLFWLRTKDKGQTISKMRYVFALQEDKRLFKRNLKETCKIADVCNVFYVSK